jgi:cell division transport system ATP-binding protein
MTRLFFPTNSHPAIKINLMNKSLNGNTTTMIEMIKVSKSYPPDVAALKDVSLSITSGEMFFIIGMSGAGKTTLLKLLCLMEAPSKGLIEIGGQPIHHLKGFKLARLRQKIGVAYQDFKLLTDRTTAENIAISMEVSYKKPQMIRNRVRNLLDQLDLADKHDTITGELSRGEQQRVALARAIANSPTMILVDEPTGNLDATTTEKVMQLLTNCNKSGATIVIATHDQSIYRHTSHRVMELRKGQLHTMAGGTIL